MLWAKIEHKFKKIANAYRFFDLNQNGTVCFNEFTLGVENLGVKISQDDCKRIFHYIDKDDNGDIDYKEFCELCEERRRGVDPYVGEVKKRKQGSDIGESPESINKLTSSYGDSTNGESGYVPISHKLARFKNKRDLNKTLPSKKNQQFSYGMKSAESDQIDQVINNEYLHSELYKQHSVMAQRKKHEDSYEKKIFKKAQHTMAS